MAAQPAAGGNLAILSQHPPVTAEDWAKNPAAAAMKAIEDLIRRMEQTPLVDKDNGARLPAEFALIKDDNIRRMHHAFPNVATAAGRLAHRKINTYMYNILVYMFRHVWPDVADAVDKSEYDDDDSEFHIRDALNNIVERFPFAVATLKAIEAHCFKGASLTNSEMRAAIEAYRIPKAATMPDSYAHNKLLDELRQMWRAVEQQPGVKDTSSERYDDLLNRLDQCSQDDRVGLNYQAFIIEHRKLPVSTKTLPLLIKNLKTWVHEQILHRQATQKGGKTVISANAITGTCPMHPGANHTATECRGLKAKTQGASSTTKTFVHKNKHQGPGKTNQFKKYHGKGKEKSFDTGKVRFDQDKGKVGSRNQGSSSFKRSYNSPSRTSGPQHPGGSLEDLLTGGYKGRKFDPAKSRKYKELQAYFTRQDIASTAGAAASTSANGANAAGQANAVFGAQGFDPRNPFALPFAFHVSIGTPEVQVGEIIQTFEMDEDGRSLMETQDERITNRVLDTSHAVGTLERYIERNINPLTRADQQTYNSHRAELLDQIKSTYQGFAEHDPEVHVKILESDLDRIDHIFQTFSSGDIEEWGTLPKRRLQIKDVFGDDATDASMEFDSDNGQEEFESDHDDKKEEFESDHEFEIDDESDTAQNLEREIQYARAASEEETTSDIEEAMIQGESSDSEDEEDYEEDQV
jgi:hypothetical protein